MSTSFHADWRADGDGTAPIPVWKIDAETGEIVWHTDYDCYTVSGNSGGAQGSLAAGKGSLEDIVYISEPHLRQIRVFLSPSTKRRANKSGH